MITTPTPASILLGTRETFDWTAGGSSVKKWRLKIGTNVGASDVYDSGRLKSVLSDTISGLPTDGSTLYVRLWYKIGGSWAFTDYTYGRDVRMGGLGLGRHPVVALYWHERGGRVIWGHC